MKNIIKPSIPKGTRDFSPLEMMRRNYIFDTVRAVFKNHAFLPIETPAMENLSTLMGKYGEEGDRLLFKILNSGDFKAGIDFETLNSTLLASKICEKGLRYDLTVPFARFVVQHQNDLSFPFKRYQIQPVWRADRPQKGRYREFYQCDVDIIGSDALINEAELMQMTDEIFTRLGISVTIKINNRKILYGIAEIAGAADKITDICTAIDKIDKIGKDNVCAELNERGISPDAVQCIIRFLEISDSNAQTLDLLENLFKGNGQQSASETGLKGIVEIRKTLEYAALLDISAAIQVDVTLARGLNYYTGAIFEVKANDVSIGSISGGGRYDDLTGIFGLAGMSGVGISFGAERIYDVLNELDLFPEDISAPVKVLLLNFGPEEEKYSLNALQQLRKAGIVAELYPENNKMGKQMSYANAKSIPFVIMAGNNEMQQNLYSLKNMKNGEQQQLSLASIIEFLI